MSLESRIASRWLQDDHKYACAQFILRSRMMGPWGFVSPSAAQCLLNKCLYSDSCLVKKFTARNNLINKLGIFISYLKII